MTFSKQLLYKVFNGFKNSFLLGEVLLFLVLWTVTFCESLAIGRLLFRCDCIVSYDWLMMTLERRHDLIMLLINKY